MAAPFEDRDEDVSQMSPEEKLSLCDLVGTKELDHSYSGSGAVRQLGELQLSHDMFMRSLKVGRKLAEEILFEISDGLFSASV